MNDKRLKERVKAFNYWRAVTDVLAAALLEEAAERIAEGWSVGMGRAIADAALTVFYPNEIERRAIRAFYDLFPLDTAFDELTKDEQQLALLLCSAALVEGKA